MGVEGRNGELGGDGGKGCAVGRGRGGEDGAAPVSGVFGVVVGAVDVGGGCGVLCVFHGAVAVAVGVAGGETVR